MSYVQSLYGMTNWTRPLSWVSSRCNDLDSYVVKRDGRPHLIGLTKASMRCLGPCRNLILKKLVMYWSYEFSCRTSRIIEIGSQTCSFQPFPQRICECTGSVFLRVESRLFASPESVGSNTLRVLGRRFRSSPLFLLQILKIGLQRYFWAAMQHLLCQGKINMASAKSMDGI